MYSCGFPGFRYTILKNLFELTLYRVIGGHTSEALTLVSSLDCRRYRRRIYLVSDGDVLSAQKAHELEFKRGGSKEIQESPFLDNLQCTILTVPRARKVHQTPWTTPFTAARSLAFCLYHFTVLPLLRMQRTAFADVLILNGPGTCFVLCLAVFVNKVSSHILQARSSAKPPQLLGLPSPVVIYVETFARVKSLSLSGKLVRPFVDRYAFRDAIQYILINALQGLLPSGLLPKVNR